MNHRYFLSRLITCALLLCAPLPTTAQGFFKSGSKNTANSAEKKLKADQSRLKTAQAKLKAFITKLKAPDGAILEDQSADQKEYEALAKQIQTLSAQVQKEGGAPTGTPVQPWSQVSGSLHWESDAARDARVVKQLNAKLSQIAAKVKNKALTPDLEHQCKASVDKIVAEIQSPKLNGKPVITWPQIQKTLKDPKVEAQRYYAKALKIKTTLGSKSFFQSEHDALIKGYTTNRNLALKYDPSLAGQLPETSGIHILPVKPDTPASHERLLKGYISKMEAINKILNGGLLRRGGVTEAEKDKQIALFQAAAKKGEAQRNILKDSFKIANPAPLPTLTTRIKIVSPEEAAEKYIAAIKKIDAKLTRQTFATKIKALSEKSRISLITQRDALEKKVGELGPKASALLPPKPKQAYANQFDAPDNAPTTAPYASGASGSGDQTAAGGTSSGTAKKDGTGGYEADDAGSKGNSSKGSGSHGADGNGGTKNKNDASASNANNIVINVGDSSKGGTGQQAPEQKPGFFTRLATPSPMGMAGMGPMGMGGMMAGGMMAPGMMGGGMMAPGMMAQASGPTIINNIGGPAAAPTGAALGATPLTGSVASTGGEVAAPGAIPSKSDLPDLAEPTQDLGALKVPTMQAPFADLIVAAGGTVTPRPKSKASANSISSWQSALSEAAAS